MRIELCVIVWLILTLFSVTGAQARQIETNVQYHLNGQLSADWPKGVSRSPDSLQVASASLLRYLRRAGYHFARIDSVTSDETGPEIYLTTGSRVTVGSISLIGMTLVDVDEQLSRFRLQPGDMLDMDVLDSDIASLLGEYARLSHHMAIAEIDEFEPLEDERTTFSIMIRVEEGPKVPLTSVRLPGSERTNTSFAARAAGLRMGEIFPYSDLSSFADRMREIGVFASVGEPELTIFEDSTAGLEIPVEELPPGTFDLVLGYLPGQSSGASGQVIGSGHLSLLSPFGSGRAFGLRLDRRPGQVSAVEVVVSDPQVAGLPFRIEASFEGYQQDSTYGKQEWSTEIGYRIRGGVEIAARYSSQTTRPGQAGIRLRNGVQRIARADASFWGIVARVRRVDNLLNPGSGIQLESVIERGDKQEYRRTVQPEGDTTRVSSVHRQERLQMTARLYQRTFQRQVLVLGLDAFVLLSDVFDESDLFRFGGANTLRGYDEDQFRASTAVRTLLEYRIQLEALSYAFLFFDMGYLETPRTADRSPSTEWYPGFGLGMQFQTAVGLVNMSYAMNDRDGVANGRIHVGLSFGL